LGAKAFTNETDFHENIKKNNMQSFERLRKILEKRRSSELVNSIVSPLSSTSVSTGYIVVSEYLGGDSSYESCHGTPVTSGGVALGLCVAVNSGYSGLPSGCPSSGSFLQITASYDTSTVYITYSYFPSSVCSSSCGSKKYTDTYSCSSVGYSNGYYQSYYYSFSSSVVVPSAAGILTQEYVSSSCSGTLAGYAFQTNNNCNSYSSSQSFKLTCSGNNSVLIEFYYSTDCSGDVSSSLKGKLPYTCAVNPFAIIADNSNSYAYSKYYSDDDSIGGETTYYKESCKAESSSSTSSSASSSASLSQAGVIAVSVVSVVVFLIIVAIAVYLIFNCYHIRNTVTNNKNNNYNNNDTFDLDLELFNRNRQKV
jgi:hypothetical protein